VTGCDDAEIWVEASVTSIRLDPLRKDRPLIAILTRSTESQNGATGIAGRVAKDIIQEIRPQSTDLITTLTRNLTRNIDEHTHIAQMLHYDDFYMTEHG
jgi:hypothetical protein